MKQKLFLSILVLFFISVTPALGMNDPASDEEDNVMGLDIREERGQRTQPPLTAEEEEMYRKEGAKQAAAILAAIEYLNLHPEVKLHAAYNEGQTQGWATRSAQRVLNQKTDVEYAEMEADALRRTRIAHKIQRTTTAENAEFLEQEALQQGRIQGIATRETQRILHQKSEEEYEAMKADALAQARIAYEAQRILAQENADFLEQEAHTQGRLQGIAALEAHRIMAKKPIPDAVRQGTYSGVEQATALIVATVIVESAKLGFTKGYEWWYQKEFTRLEQQRETQQIVESVKKEIKEKQQLLIGNSSIVSTVGEQTGTAQQIFEKQFEQNMKIIDKAIENGIEKQTDHLEKRRKEAIEEYNKKMDDELQQKITELKEKLEAKKNAEATLKEKETALKEEYTQKMQEYENQQNEIYTQALNNLVELLEEKRGEAIEALLADSPNRKFLKIYDQYTDLALGALEEQRGLMDGSLIRQTIEMVRKQQAATAA